MSDEINNQKQHEINFVRRYCPQATDKECLEKYNLYRMYREEEQTAIVSRQYAGMI